ncbi:12384_t:CDS:2, partial [Racocetra fulgida]
MAVYAFDSSHDDLIHDVSYDFYGKRLATCSSDQKIKPRNSGKRWALKASLVDSSGSVKDIEFAPNNWGLKLATVAADGVLRIYEALEVNNLADWSMMEEVEIITPGTVNKEADGNYCLSWCPWKPQVSPMIVVGCGKENCAKVLHGHEDAIHDVSWAPNMGRYLIDHKVGIFKLTNKPDGYSVENIAMLSEHGVE